MKFFRKKEDNQKKYYVELAKYLEVDYAKFMKMTLKETLDIRPYISEEALKRLASGIEIELDDLLSMTMKEVKYECDYLIKESSKRKATDSKVETVENDKTKENKAERRKVNISKEEKNKEKKESKIKKENETIEVATQINESQEQTKNEKNNNVTKDDSFKSKFDKYVSNFKKEKRKSEQKEDKILNPIVNADRKEYKSFIKTHEFENQESNIEEFKDRPSIKEMFGEIGKGFKWVYRKIRHLDSNESNYVSSKTKTGKIKAGTVNDLEPNVGLSRSI